MNDVIEDQVVLPPSVRSLTADPRMSPRYVHVDSSEIIKMMTNEGFKLKSANSSKNRIRSAGQFSRHVLDFRYPEAPMIGDGEAEPRVLFINSHDGTSTASVMAGVYRFVCDNGLVIGSTYARERVRHAGQQARELVKRMQDLAKNTAPLFTQIDEWTKKEMTKNQQREFARLASTLRFDDPGRFDVEELLRARRSEDEGNSLWRVFNRVQENVMAGGLEGLSANGVPVTSRAITSVHSSVKFNEILWRLAEDFSKI